jgi:uncharacterized protein YjiS (DUF1127 family)
MPGISVKNAGPAVMADAARHRHIPRSTRLEKPMFVTATIHAIRPSLAQARAERAAYLARLMRIGAKRLARRLRAFAARIALARQYERELGFLMQADDRTLMDIGVTRGDVHAAARQRWFSPGRMIAAAAERRKQAMQVAETRHALPRVEAPALSPATPVKAATMETANFR